MESPIRKMLKKNDYVRHKLFRKIKRRRLSEIKKQSKAAEKELKRRLKWTAPKLTEGKDPESTSANVHKTNDGYYATYGTDPARWPLTVKESNDDWLQQSYTDELGRVYNPPVQAYTPPAPQAEITADNRSFANNNPLWNYAAKLGRQLGDPNKYGVVGGEYTLPAIGLAGLLSSDAALAGIDAAVESTGIPTWITNNPITTATIGTGIEAPMYSELILRRLIDGDNSGGLFQDAMDATVGLGALSRIPTIASNAALDLARGWNWANRNYVLPYRLSRAINQGVSENSVITGYNRNPRNLDTGSLWDYLNYLDEVFPNSLINDVQWHGGKSGIEKLSSDTKYKQRLFQASGKHGIYTTPNKRLGYAYANNGQPGHDLYPVKINAENPMQIALYSANNTLSEIGIATLNNTPFINDRIRFTPDHISDYWFNKKIKGKYDSISDEGFQNIVFNPEQTLILGSNEDVIRFSNWMHRNRGINKDYTHVPSTEPEVSTIDFNTARTAQELPIKKQVMPPVWLRENLPGYMIKSLSADSKLGKLVSKQGTISLKNVEAWANKSDTPAIDKELLGKVLEAHSGEKTIDYNTLRREVQELIPLYNRMPQTKYEDYGIDKLGFNTKSSYAGWYQRLTPLEYAALQAGPNEPDLILKDKYIFNYNNNPFDKPVVYNKQTNEYIPYDTVVQEAQKIYTEKYNKALADAENFMRNKPTLNTFTFESPGITGNTKHYNGNPIGHSRTYTTQDEPDVLHVMESLSDWALQAHKGKLKPALLNEIVFNEETGLFENPNPIEFLKYSPIESRMIDTYAQRLILENLKYAAENGLTKMRYPTSETAAKIEGYLMKELENPEYTKAREDVYRNAIINLSKKAEDAGYNDFSKVLQNKDIINYFAEYESFPLTFYDLYRNTLDKILKDPKLNIEEFGNSVDKQIKQLENNINRYSLQYSPQHQTILKKYADFPKLYLKLFGKETNVRTVTDSKGNTWYEVDVPQNYLDGTAEMLFDKGKDLRLPKFTFIQPIYNRK